MTRIQTILLPFALLLGACDPADAEVAAADLEARDELVAPSPDAKGKRGGKLARLDADKDGAISVAEAQGTRLADKFSKLDRDADGKLTRDELHAMKAGKADKGRRGHGGEGRTMTKDPAERAAKILARRDADNNGSLSAAEVQGSRMADKFAALDADSNGAVTRDELVAFKSAHGRRDAK